MREGEEVIPLSGTLWVFGLVGLAVAGLVPVTWAALRVARAVQGLAGELDRAARRLGPEQAALGAELRNLQGSRVPESVDDGVPSP